MRRTLALLVAMALVAAAFCAGTAAAYPVAQATNQAPGKVTSYWTAERMQKAVPADRDSRPVPAANRREAAEAVELLPARAPR